MNPNTLNPKQLADLHKQPMPSSTPIASARHPTRVLHDHGETRGIYVCSCCSQQHNDPIPNSNPNSKPDPDPNRNSTTHPSLTMPPWSLISPASRGIGFALARQVLKSSRAPVVATARGDLERVRGELLEGLDVDAGRLRVMRLDVLGEFFSESRVGFCFFFFFLKFRTGRGCVLEVERLRCCAFSRFALRYVVVVLLRLGREMERLSGC